MPGVVKMAWELIVPESTEPAADMQEKFANGLVVNASLINDRRIAAVGSDGAFNDKVAAPSNLKWAPMVDSAFVSRAGRSAQEIKNAQGLNLQEAFQKWSDNLDLAFATVDGVVAKGFVTNVQNKKGNWSIEAGRRTLRMTGDRVRGRGVSAIASALFVGDSIAASWLRPGDTWLAGLPYDISLTGLKGTLKAGLTQLLTRAGLTIIMSGYNTTIMTNQNAFLIAALTALADPAKCDPFIATEGATDTYCKFKKVGPIFSLKCQTVLGGP
jgi:hypothetical protein